MSRPDHPVQSGTFLITSIVAERRAIFRRDVTAQLFFDILKHYREEGHYKLWEYVIMPDHVHLLLTPQNTSLERAVQLIKGGFSRRLGSRFPVWQKGFSDRRVRDRAEFDHYVQYIQQNPVRRRYCLKPEDYRWSSAWTGYTEYRAQQRNGPSAYLGD